MSFRSVLLGLSLGLFIAAVTYFNDFVVRQTMFINHFLPPAVFGLTVLIVLLVNPLLRLVKKGAPLRPAEIAVVVAIALAACAWPGSNFWRYGGTIPTTPIHWYRNVPLWQANGVMSYVPGGSGELAEGQLLDARGFARQLVADADAGVGIAPGLWFSMPARAQATLRSVAEHGRGAREETRAIVSILNERLVSPQLFEEASLPADAHPGEPMPPAVEGHHLTRWNRTVLARAYPGHILPLPRGGGALVGGGEPRPEVIDTLISGRPGQQIIAPEVVPWARWWPTLRLWAGVALLLGLASLCVSLIVHPQWSQRELLPYPLAKLVQEIGARRKGSALPNLARSRGFWIALGVVMAIHALNGLRAWYPELPTVPLRFNFTLFQNEYPNAARVSHSWGLFYPYLFFSVVGFAFFVPTAVSLSLGIAPVLWVAFGTLMMTQGIALDYNRTEPSRTNFLRFGAFLAMAVMILYTGRRYYFNVLCGAWGAKRHAGTPGYAIWAARLCVPLVLAAGALLWTAGMDAWVAALVIGITMLSWIVLNRIVCETGMIFVTNTFIVGVIVEGLVGFDALGPTGLLLVAMTSWAIIGDPREAAMPFLSNGLAIAERAGGGREVVRRITPWLAIMLIASMLVAGFVTLGLQYEHGITAMNNDYAARWVPSQPFDRVAHHTATAAAMGTLGEATAREGWSRLAAIDPAMEFWPWLAFGFALVLVTSSARLRLPSFPLHPVLFLIWGTYASTFFGFSFLVGWVVKAAVLRIGGAKGYVAVKPIMVGLIAGELLAALGWMLVGATYFFCTGLQPVWYSVYPS